jgi:outer membrane protein assembly factor BamC
MKNFRVVVLPLLLVITTACSFNKLPARPDVAYSTASDVAKPLQVPPDLTAISNGEQFILPGTENGALSRNRLLPTFADVRYVRQGNQNWLEFTQPAEAIWPKVIEFIAQQKLLVEKTQPTTGLILTQWRSSTDKADGGLLKNLISNDEVYSRLAFRLERNGNGTRLFARSQQLTGKDVNTAADAWPASSHNPEQVSVALTRLLVFFGADEQKARGILNDAQISAVVDDAELLTTTSGSHLIVHKGFKPAFNDVESAVAGIDYTVIQSDGSVGQLEVANAPGADAYLVSLSPVHHSAVKVSVATKDGAKLSQSNELAFISALRDQLI